MSSESENNSDILDRSRMYDKDKMKARTITEFEHNRMMRKLGLVMAEVGRQFPHESVSIRYEWDYEGAPTDIVISIGTIVIGDKVISQCR